MASACHPVEGVLHVGVRAGNDLPDYRSSGASPCIYVEPVQATFERLEKQFEDDPWHIALSAVCSDKTVSSGSTERERKSVGDASSNLSSAPIYTVDSLTKKFSSRRPPNLLVLDARGAELIVLNGANETLPSVDGVFLAVSETRPHPLACALGDIQSFHKCFDLRLRWLDLDGDGRGYAFFSRPRMIEQALPTYGGNLALGKFAHQSSLSQWSRSEMLAEAKGAINGQITGAFGFHTDLEDAAWWLIDLGGPHPLHEIRIYNRLGEVRSRARTLRIVTSEDGEEWWEVHDQAGYTFGGADGRPLRVPLDPCCARYVALRLAERSYFHLDEVEIY